MLGCGATPTVMEFLTTRLIVTGMAMLAWFTVAESTLSADDETGFVALFDGRVVADLPTSAIHPRPGASHTAAAAATLAGTL